MQDRVTVITGGGRGLGRAIALSLARKAEGRSLALCYRSDRESAEQTLAQVHLHAPNSRIYPLDIADATQVQSTIDQINEALGPIDTLINNAFKSRAQAPKKVHEIDPQDWLEDLATNLSGHFLMARACLPSMRTLAWGRIVFIGSLAQRGEAGRAAYSTAKRGLVGLSNTLAQEYAREGITSNVVHPGFIEAGAFMRLTEEIQARALKRVPSRKAGKPEQVAALIAHLCSDEGGYINGEELRVDGGAR